MTEEIKIFISKEGQVKIDVEGVKGVSCKDLTKDLEKAFGITVDDKKTSEYYEQDNQQQNYQYGGGY